MSRAILPQPCGYRVALRIAGQDESPALLFRKRSQAEAWIAEAEERTVSEWLDNHGDPELPIGWECDRDGFILDNSEFYADVEAVYYADAEPEPDTRIFSCCWGDGYGDDDREIFATHTFLFFTGENGYPAEDIIRIDCLPIGETATLDDIGGEHSVTRIS